MAAFNSISMKDLLPELFARSKHFTPTQYYQAMIQICPECQKKWYERIPTEADIQKMITKLIGNGQIDGKTSVPTAEKKLGIKIDPGYKYPNGQSDLEYHLSQFYKYGLFSVFTKTTADEYKSCFECVLRNGKEHYSKKPDKNRAYLAAWRKLQYPDRDAMTAMLQADWQQLCELNPVLKTISFDTKDAALLKMAISGTIFGFQPRDIELFVNEHGKGGSGTAFRHSKRIIQESAAAGLPSDFHFNWVPHSDTIAEIGRRYREKNNQLQTAMLQTTMQKD